MAELHPLLRLERVSKDYATADGSPPLSVLRDICLEVARGDTLAFVGPSGCGKSTLLNIIGTLDQPTAGDIFLNGEPLRSLGDIQLAALRNQQIGFVFQAHHLLLHCTVWENVLVPTLARAKSEARNPKPETPEQRATRLLQRVGLGERLHHRPSQLSGGERQRVAVVRALINQPALLLADEPTGALDRASAESLGQLLVELNREEGVTLLVVTHAPDLAHRMSRVMELRDGTLRRMTQ